MQIEITVKVISDDHRVTREAENGLAVATSLPGADPAVQKSDFLGQVESLFRTIVDNQVPALYAAVYDAAEQQVAPEETEAQSHVREKLQRLRDNNARKVEEDNQQEEQ